MPIFWAIFHGGQPIYRFLCPNTTQTTPPQEDEMARSFHIDCFSSLDDLTKQQRRDKIAVLNAITAAGRFSVFDAGEPPLGATITEIFRLGWAKNAGGGYPWTNVEITEAGRAALAATLPS
jgi:hypothetical protein